MTNDVTFINKKEKNSKTCFSEYLIVKSDLEHGMMS